MTFQPRMQNKIGGFSVIGGMHRRYWNGMVADIWNVNCAAQAGGYYVARDPRLFILLEQRGAGKTNVRPSPRAQGQLQDHDSGRISYIPAGMELWVDMAGVEFVRHLDVHFDAEMLSQRLMENIDPVQLDRPQLHFNDPRVMALAELIAAECENPEPLHDLYGDGLTLSLLIDVLQVRGTQPRKRSGLATWQLRRAVDYIEENCTRAIRLEELAALTGLSQSHFSHAFKASTGLPPHQWQTQARLERAKQLLLNSEMPLTTVAVETGFADQAHFTRVFSKNVGAAPAGWKRSRLA
ncbi:AraC family transcriptional regulator [Rhizobium sp. CNPSo 4062]|uniref:AraC family transcriptional regulator n=1 Tax=Rhizobium sp. CNPSo 4062 TaxID=3021410 RepID=UPI00254DE74F|nr:AraC family transcriptional regulator [Rhizobium sp. CNPSo 4062]MDK4701611.1 AraC family transcriptional regulator [Rhizobium sp. CNPSo 4062]